MPAQNDRVPVYGIDIIRFFAALAVVLYHFTAKPFLAGEESTLHAILEPGHPVPAGAVWWGWVGVQVFFVISGAVIGFSATRSTARGFAISRIVRLWPAMLVCAVFVAVLNVGFWRHQPMTELVLLVKSLLFWPVAPWVTGQIWTLPIEITFYGLVWLLVLAGRVRNLDRLAAWLAFASGGFWLLQGQGLVSLSPVLSLLLVRHGIYFALGITMMACGTRGFTPGRAAVIALCLVGAWFEIALTLSWELPGWDLHPLQPFLIWLAACAGIALSIMWRLPFARRAERGGGKAAHAMRTAGLVTYPLYLVHLQPGGLVLAALLWRGVPVWLAAVPAVAVSLAIAWLVAARIEPSITRRLRALLERIVPGSGGRDQHGPRFAGGSA